jgi:N-acetylglucosaminyldiphosphoundecaprenol N-acetyl-beta-D-mannosaminyltransferase
MADGVQESQNVTAQAAYSPSGSVEMPRWNHVDFMGFQFDPLDLDAAVRIVAARSRARDPFQYVVTPNAAIAVARRKDPQLFAPLLENASLVLNDSRILQLLGGFSGVTLPVACGSDLTERLFESEIDSDEEVVLIGGDAAVAKAVAQRYRLTKLRHHQPPMGLRSNTQAVADAAAFAARAKARFTFIAVGCPQQEIVAKAIKDRGDAIGVGLCIGASLEFLAGAKQRAPKWIQQMRLEWLHRLASEPGRLWRRYLLGAGPLLAAWRAWERDRRKSKA